MQTNDFDYPRPCDQSNCCKHNSATLQLGQNVRLNLHSMQEQITVLLGILKNKTYRTRKRMQEIRCRDAS